MAASGRAGSRERVAWSVAGVAIAAAVVVMAAPARTPRPAPAEPAAAPPAGAPPDLASMTPRERFDRLYNRVMQAAETGNQQEATRFAPMAFAAYGQLDSVDTDARYHAALLHLHVGNDVAAALRLADSIAAEAPRHLFVPLLRGLAGQQRGDAAASARAQRDFLAAWDAEIALDRPEYRDHRRMLDDFRARALSQGARNRM